LAADVCLGATARSSLISKKQEAAIRLTHPRRREAAATTVCPETVLPARQRLRMRKKQAQEQV